MIGALITLLIVALVLYVIYWAVGMFITDSRLLYALRVFGIGVP